MFDVFNDYSFSRTTAVSDDTKSSNIQNIKNSKKKQDGSTPLFDKRRTSWLEKNYASGFGLRNSIQSLKLRESKSLDIDSFFKHFENNLIRSTSWFQNISLKLKKQFSLISKHHLLATQNIILNKFYL